MPQKQLLGSFDSSDTEPKVLLSTLHDYRGYKGSKEPKRNVPRCVEMRKLSNTAAKMVSSDAAFEGGPTLRSAEQPEGSPARAVIMIGRGARS